MDIIKDIKVEEKSLLFQEERQDYERVLGMKIPNIQYIMYEMDNFL